MRTLGLTYLWFIRTGKSILWKFSSQVLGSPNLLFPSFPIWVKCSSSFESCQCRGWSKLRYALCDCVLKLFSICIHTYKRIFMAYGWGMRITIKQIFFNSAKKWSVTTTLSHALPRPHLFPHTPEGSTIFNFYLLRPLFSFIV